MEHQIIPSIIANSQRELEERIRKLGKHSNFIQLDVMDGEFVTQTSLEFDFKLPKGVKAEAHLMVNDPRGWFAKHHTQVTSVIIHYESDVRVHEFIRIARKYRKKIGIGINPSTPSEDIAQYTKLVDKILVMTVKPGKYGASFISEALGKIKYLRGLNPMIDIEVDGGINPETLVLCERAGANQFVVGSYLQKSKDINKAWRELN